LISLCIQVTYPLCSLFTGCWQIHI
jgi:hypothetical protein